MNKIIPILSILLFSLSCAQAQVDTAIGLTAPGNVSHDYKELTHYLCDGLPRERDKANAIYNWITHNIRYDIKSFQKGDIKHPTVNKVLKTRLALCEGYSMLFTEMCREAGLKAVNIDGYAKDWVFDNGDKLYIPRHQWSAVMIYGAWELADPTWGAGGIVQAPGPVRRILNKITRKKVTYAKHLKFQFKYKPEYFAQDPAEFKRKHLPSDPLWQLADTIMPLSVFEAGDTAITKFNAHCRAKKNDPELTRISQLSEEQKTFELADRAYEFNNRYPVILALKQTYRATSEVEKALTDSTIEDGGILVSDAVTSLKKSEYYIKEQKKIFPDEYSVLKKKNKTKNQLAKQDIRKIKTDDKRLIADSKKFVSTAKSRADKLNKNAGKAEKRTKGVYAEKIDETVTAKAEKSINAPELRILMDSIVARDAQIQDLEDQAAVLSGKISETESENRSRLDTFAINLDLADSMLVLQTKARLSMGDNYDDEVILCINKFNEYKYNKADTLQKYYLTVFDTIDKMQEHKQKLEVAEMDLYKKNIAAMEQYKKWNSTDPDLKSNYKVCVAKYLACIHVYNDGIERYLAYIKGNRKLFEYLAKINKKEIILAGYMDKAEDMRKILEQHTLVKKQQMDVDENKHQELAVKNIREQVDKIAGK